MTIGKNAIAASVLLLAYASLAGAASITVNTATRYQAIEGFGGGAVYYTNWISAHPYKAEIYDTVFTGLGLSYLRIGNWDQDSTKTDALTQTAEIVQAGKSRLGSRMKVLMSSWTPPASLKANNNIKGGTSNNTLKKVNNAYVYDQFAHWWARSLAHYAAAGVVPDVISIQNEPDMNPSYEGMMLAKSQGDTAGYPQALAAVHDTLAKMATRPRIFGPEPLGIGYSNFQGYMNALDASDLDGYAYHLYHGNNATQNEKYQDLDGFNTILQTLASSYSTKPALMTEFCPMRSPAQTQGSDLLSLARLIRNALVHGNTVGYINWELIYADWRDPQENISQMIHMENPWVAVADRPTKWKYPKGYTIGPEFHGMRHFSKFITPGWNRISSTSSDAAVPVVAFASTDNDSLTLVAINTANASKSLAFAPTGFVLSEAWQSQSGGPYSEKLATTSSQTSWTLPDSSLLTLVWVKATASSSSSSSLSSSSSSVVSSSSSSVSASSSSSGISSSSAGNTGTSSGTQLSSSSSASTSNRITQNIVNEQPAFYRVCDLAGHVLMTSQQRPEQLPRGLWMIESLRANGSRIAVQLRHEWE